LKSKGLGINMKEIVLCINKKMTYTFKIDNVYIALFSEKNNDEYELSAYMFGEQNKKKIIQHHCVIVDTVEIKHLFTRIYEEYPSLVVNHKIPA